MTRQAQSLRMPGKVSFDNGTEIAWSGEAQIVQWTAAADDPAGGRVPAEIDVTPQWLRALGELEIAESETLHMDVRAGTGADELVLRLKKPPAGTGCVLLYQDEGGGLSWHFPDAGSTPAPTFTIPARTSAARAALSGERPHAASQGRRWPRPLRQRLDLGTFRRRCPHGPGHRRY